MDVHPEELRLARQYAAEHDFASLTPDAPDLKTWLGPTATSIDNLVEECREVASLGIPAIILFGIPPDKDEDGSGAFDDRVQDPFMSRREDCVRSHRGTGHGRAVE